MTASPGLVASDAVVANTRGGHAPCIAEHTFALLLVLTHRIDPLAADQRDHAWTLHGDRLRTLFSRYKEQGGRAARHPRWVSG